MMLTNATTIANKAIKDVNKDAWNSFHVLDDVVDGMSMYTLTSLPGKSLSEEFLDFFDIYHEDPATIRPPAKTRTPRIRRNSPLYWRCPALCEAEYNAAARIPRPGRAFAARVSLPLIAEGVHFMEGLVSMTLNVPCEVADRASRGSLPAMIAEELAVKFNLITSPQSSNSTMAGMDFEVEDMDWEPTPDNEKFEQMKSFDFSVVDFSKDEIVNVANDIEHYNGNDDDDGDNNERWPNMKDEEETFVPIVVIEPFVPAEGKVMSTEEFEVAPLISPRQECKEEPIRLRRSARLAAKTHQMGDKSQSLLGSIMVNGQRRSARLLKTVG